MWKLIKYFLRDDQNMQTIFETVHYTIEIYHHFMQVIQESLNKKIFPVKSCGFHSNTTITQDTVTKSTK